LIDFFYKILEKVDSQINGEITIYQSFGSPKMTIGGLLQSGGIVADIWKKCSTRFKIQDLRFKNILILGLGCGTAAKIFSKSFPDANIIGVEIDPVVIDIGRKYFGVSKIPNLKIVCQDANKFKSNISFDLIIVDLYLGENIPDKLQNNNFLKNIKNLLSKDGIAVFNRIFWDEHRIQAHNFVNRSVKVFKKTELIRTVANLLVICS
jgi:spermidine synthase